MSIMEMLELGGHRTILLWQNKRSARGICDIPTRIFYGLQLTSHSSSSSAELYPYARPTAKILQDILGQVKGDAFVRYVLIPTARQNFEANSKSQFNLEFASFGIHLIQALLENGIPGRFIKVITYYSAQAVLYRDAIKRLRDERGGARSETTGSSAWADVVVNSVDHFQGGQSPIVILDTVVTDYVGFTKDRKRVLVSLTRATDFQIVIGNPLRLREHQDEPSPMGIMFRHARKLGVLTELYKDSPGASWLTHHFVSDSRSLR